MRSVASIGAAHGFSQYWVLNVDRGSAKWMRTSTYFLTIESPLQCGFRPARTGFDQGGQKVAGGIGLGFDRFFGAVYRLLLRNFLGAAVNNHMIFSPERNGRIAREPEACSIVGLSSSTIRNRLEEGGRWHDANFPKPIRLGTGPRCAIGWRVEELLAYLDGQRQP